MDTVLRVLFFLLAGTLLLVLNIWFIRAVRRTAFTAEVVIEPFKVIGLKADDAELGAGLAEMLQARLGQIQAQLEASQRSLVAAKPASPAGIPQAEAERDEAFRTSLSLLSPVAIPTAVFKPVNIDVKVGGVEVGGVFSWLQRAIVRPRTLTFTAYFEERSVPADPAGDGDPDGEAAAENRTYAVVTGNLQAFSDFESKSLWLETEATPHELATMTAYALIQRKLSEDGVEEVGALEVKEFRSLLDALHLLAKLNDRISKGRSAGDGFEKVLAALEPLIEKVPDWHELKYLTASVAENAGGVEQARQYYEQLRQVAERGDSRVAPGRELLASVETKLGTLAGSRAPDVPKDFIDSAADYARRLGLPPPEPEIVIAPSMIPGTLATWNTKEKRYEVEVQAVDHPGLDRYVALMGRFMAKHYARCFEGDGVVPNVPLWQELRSSLVEYIISTDEDSPGKSDQRAYSMPLFRRFQAMDRDARANRAAVRGLALKMLSAYDCDWTPANLLEKTLVANQGAVPAEVIEEAFAGLPGSSS